VEPAFVLEFIETSIENLKRSEEKEINNIISREQLMANLIEKKKNLEKIMRGEVDLKSQSSLNDMPEESIPSPKEKRNKSKNAESHGLGSQNDGELTHKISTKSMSTSCVVEPSKPSPPIQESPSMSVLTSKLEDISLTSPSNPDTSLKDTLSEVEVSSGGTTTTITINSTTDDATIITKEDDEAATPVLPKEEIENPDFNAANGICKAEENEPNIIIEEQDVYQIVESIRKGTNLSHELSQVALRVFISEMETLMPNITKYLNPFKVHLTTNSLTVPDNFISETHDSQRLRNLFSELADAKNDTDQRCWVLYEDEVDITNYLTEILRILVDADPKICRYEMSCDAYNAVNNLVLYYQMESRWTIRKLLLKTFKVYNNP
jgi:hypothetical protein